MDYDMFRTAMFRTACCAGPPPGNSDMIRVRLRLELMNMINWTRIKIFSARKNLEWEKT